MPRMPARPHRAGKREARAFEARGKWQPTYQKLGQWGHGPTIRVLCKQHHPPPLNPYLTTTHGHTHQFFLGDMSHHVVLEAVLVRWCYPDLLVYLTLYLKVSVL